MAQVSTDYVFLTPEGGWRIAGARVSLDSVVHAYVEGQSPEAIADFFPTLSLEQIHGAIAFCLRHRHKIDEYLKCQDARWETLRQESERANTPLLKRLRSRSNVARDGTSPR